MRKKLLILAVGVVLFLLLGAGSNLLSTLLVPIIGDRMEWRSRLLMGRYGIDCGRVEVRGDPKEATACALKAQADGKPFRVRYDILGYDSAVAGGTVRTPTGQLYALSFDSDPMGRPGASFSRQVVSETPCPQPIHLWVNPKGRINCFQQQLSQPANIMSPNVDPY